MLDAAMLPRRAASCSKISAPRATRAAPARDHHLDNPASRRVLAKLGFREVRREAHFLLAHGGDVECAVMEREIGEEQLQVPMAA